MSTSAVKPTPRTASSVDQPLDRPGERKRETKRVRRSAEEAQRLILDAAEERLAAQGPEGIRLQDIARDVGISHPAILHHFESREGLVRALIARASGQLREKLLVALEGKDGGANVKAHDLIANVFEALSDRGTAQLLSWMRLTGRSHDNTASGALMTEIAGVLHERRVEDAEKAKEPAPDREDSLFIAMLTANAAFGDAIIGRKMAEEAGLGQEGVARFRLWFAELLHDHVDARKNRQTQAGE